MFAIKFEGKYLRYGSYSTATKVDRPEQASLYNRLIDAERKLREWKLYIEHKMHSPREDKCLSIWEVEFSHTEKQVSS